LQPPPSQPQPSVRLLCQVSIVYDAVLGLMLLAGQSWIERLTGLAALNYPVNGQLNGLFALSIAAGYWIPLRGLGGGRLYLWVFGVALKAAGAVLITLRVLALGDPPSFLVFSLFDGLLALWTWQILHRLATAGHAPTQRRPPC